LPYVVGILQASIHLMFVMCPGGFNVELFTFEVLKFIRPGNAWRPMEVVFLYVSAVCVV
jgi:hypothetical protein